MKINIEKILEKELIGKEIDTYYAIIENDKINMPQVIRYIYASIYIYPWLDVVYQKS